MTVEYSWFINGKPIKEGRKASIVFVDQPGQYQCVVKVNGNVEKSATINVVEVGDDDQLAPSNDHRDAGGTDDVEEGRTTQENSGKHTLLYTCGNIFVKLGH